jgi:hypothetical protein
MTFMQTVNTCFIPFILYLTEKFTREQLMQNLLFMFIANTFLVPFFLFFDFIYLIRILRKRYFLNKSNSINITQFKLHQIVQGPDFKIWEY